MPAVSSEALPSPEQFTVAVLMERRPGVTRWQPYVWAPVGLVAGAVADGPVGEPVPMPADGDVVRELWRGFRVRLHRDEAESYYYNLVSARPLAFVVLREGEAGRRVPALVTLCFDEANAYTEGDSDVEPLPMPAELVQWLERYVLDNYVPEKRVKRERRSWTEEKR